MNILPAEIEDDNQVEWETLEGYDSSHNDIGYISVTDGNFDFCLEQCSE